MATIDITSQSFIDHLKKPGILVVDLWASWCGPCRRFAPVFAAASERHPDIVWGKVDTEAEPEIAEALQVRSIPTLAVFRDGVLVFLQAGMLPPRALDELAQKVRALDPRQVQAAASAPAP